MDEKFIHGVNMTKLQKELNKFIFSKMHDRYLPNVELRWDLYDQLRSELWPDILCVNAIEREHFLFMGCMIMCGQDIQERMRDIGDK